MQAYQLHFNPPSGKAKSWLRRKKQKPVFDTFCFIPQTKDEHHLGKLFLAGEMLGKEEESVSQMNLLTNLAETINQEFYSQSIDKPKKTEEALGQALAEGNEFLTNSPADLNFVALAIKPDLTLYLSKLGKIKILLLHDGEVFNIAEDMNVAHQPNNKFPNLAEGELSQGDKILIMTHPVFEALNHDWFFKSLFKMKSRKGLKKLLKRNKKLLRTLNGFSLLVFVKKEKNRVFLTLPQIANYKARVESFFLKIVKKALPRSPHLHFRLAKALPYIIIFLIIIALGIWLF